MNGAAAVAFLTKIGCAGIREKANGWVEACCPLAAHRHASGTDRHPSFGVEIVADGGSLCRCHGCGFRGNPARLLWSLSGHNGKNYNDVNAWLLQHDKPGYKGVVAQIEEIENRTKDTSPVEVAGMVVPQARAPSAETKAKLEILVPESDLTELRTMPKAALDYLSSRKPFGISEKAIEAWELGWEPNSKRIVVPTRDLQGRLIALSGRATTPVKKRKWLHSENFPKSYYMYGEHLFPKNGIAYLVEGFFDVIGLWDRGYRGGLAFMGSSISPFQAEKVIKLASKVVIIPDGDKAGKETAESVQAVFERRRFPVRTIPVPAGLDPDQLSEEFLLEHLGLPNANGP